MNDFQIKFEELIELLVQNFAPEIVVICEIPPILNNVETNNRVDLYNDYFNCAYGSKSGF